MVFGSTRLRLCSTLLASLFAIASLTRIAKAGGDVVQKRLAVQGMALVGPGIYRPLYPASPAEKENRVPAFFLDIRPVTNGEYLAFVKNHSEWRRDSVKRLFADDQYLSNWQSAVVLGKGVRARQPVTRVSWFSAKAYCAARGARLPTEGEWELAAAASATKADGSGDPAWRARILAWYAEPASEGELPDVGRTARNFWGVTDLHGVVWEWVYDYGASLVTADSREKGQGDAIRFCGGAGANARDPSDYAAFMRIAFRSSLEARYTSPRLGFRCAKDIPSGGPS